jgi:putative FmdB family regulatory protein
MPLYEYKCKSCGFSFEITQKFSDEPIQKCANDKCNGEVEKVIFSNPIDFKGSGWFRDGYQKK